MRVHACCSLSLLALTTLLGSCSSEPGPSQLGSQNTTGGGVSSGGASTGGMTTGGGPTGGASTGGLPSATGGTSTGGTPATGGSADATGGTSGGSSGGSTGGSTPGGSGGSSAGAASGGGGMPSGGGNAGGGAGGASVGGSSATGGSGADVMPSEMCGKMSGMPSLNIPNTLMSIPDTYDGTTPVPVVIAFHAAGNGNDQMRGIIGSTFDGEYMMFYPKSAGSGWDNNQDPPKVDAIFDALDQNACYDKHRVFAAGHSSGAQFVVQRLCAGESRWRAVSPVASSVYCSSWDPIPALVIHGIGDTEREAYGLNDGNGEKDIVPYRTSNSCQESSTPVEVEGCSSGGVQVEPGCRDFDGCGERTRWCQHNDPQYGTSHHGVPCFGARVMKEFFDMYP